MSTIYAVASGRPPAAIAIVRVSGPEAFATARKMVGTLPQPRYATLRSLRDEAGEVLDRALVLTFPGPHSTTGEDVVEFHCHGGGAVVRAVQARLGREPGVRLAEPGEFTRRGLLNERLDVLQVEALADLLEAETEQQRRAAIDGLEGKAATLVRGWMDALTQIAARVEVMIDYSDEDDGADEGAIDAIRGDLADVVNAMRRVLTSTSVERLGEPVTVAIVGPPNAGKSTLLNRLAQRDAAIVSPIAGTTRDRVEVGVLRKGCAYLLVDTAGLRDDGTDEIERIGIQRARDAASTSDVVLWTGDGDPPDDGFIRLWMRSDLPGRGDSPAKHQVKVNHGDWTTIDAVWSRIEEVRPPRLKDGTLALHDRELRKLARAIELVTTIPTDILILGEALRATRQELAALCGADPQQQMLDSLFGRFCLGK